MIPAAGVLCWRATRLEPEILVVHRPRKEDWSFPKGRVDPGEIPSTTARRELWEETGVRTTLGPYVGQVDYLINTDKPKQVRYWSSHVSEQQWAAAQAEFEANKEVDERRWIPIGNARDVLTYDHDRGLLAEFALRLDPAVTDTIPVVVLRHAKSIPRSSWSGPEDARGLTGRGRAQALSLGSDLRSWEISEAYTSPWTRCVETVAPYVAATEVSQRCLESLTEADYTADPERTEREIGDAAATGRPLLICTHRPVLPAAMTAIADHFDPASRTRLLPAANLAPGAFAVLQFARRRDGTFRLLSHEVHEPVLN